MRAERKSPLTVRTYADAVHAFFRWCESTSTTPQLSKPVVQKFIADLLDGGAETNTTRARAKGLRRFSAWLAAERELAEDALLGLRPPTAEQKVVHALDEEQLRLLLKACSGRSMAERRDEALIRLMVETGARAGEVIALQTADVDLAKGLVTIRRGKGGKGRLLPVGAQTAQSLDRYLRARRQAGHGDNVALWVGRTGTFGYQALDQMLKKHARAAGIENFHAHLLRHTFATRWKAARGSDDGLMSIAGWSSRAMIDRYAGAAAADRAAIEARALGLGDF